MTKRRFPLSNPRRRIAAGLAAFALATSCALSDAAAQGWPGFGGDAQHTGNSTAPAQSLDRIRWQMPVDLDPPTTSRDRPVHYGSPVITPANTVVVPVKLSKFGGFQVEGHSGADGTLLWTMVSDYLLPPHGWTPSFNPVLSPDGRVYFPGGGGTLMVRNSPDAPDGTVGKVAFYGIAWFLKNPVAFYTSIMINTPLTADAEGNIFFGFQVIRANPLGLVSGLARLDVNGGGASISALFASGNDPSIKKVAHNAAPALSPDQKTVYVTVTDANGLGFGNGYLVALDAETLTPLRRIRLKDPTSGRDAFLVEASTSSPTVGPDGAVFVGVIEDPFGKNHGRGWLLQFDGTLANAKVPGLFGWDATATIVPTSAVPFYTGLAEYLVMTNYNDYAKLRGSGVSQLAILDPTFPAKDLDTGATVMREVTTTQNPTPDPEFVSRLPRARREWSVTSAVLDPATTSIIAGSEDGRLYRWNLTTATIEQSITLGPGGNQSYSPTVIGPDGTVYAINGSILYAVGE